MPFQKYKKKKENLINRKTEYKVSEVQMNIKKASLELISPKTAHCHRTKILIKKLKKQLEI